MSSEWSDTVIDGKGMLHGLEIEIGRLIVYAVWSVQMATAIFAFIRFFLFYCEKKARGHEFLKGLYTNMLWRVSDKDTGNEFQCDNTWELCQ